MKNFKGTDSHAWFNGLIYGTLMACSLATVSIFASEMVHFSESARLARWRDQAPAGSAVAMVGNTTAKTNLAGVPLNSVKTAHAPTNSFKPKARI